MAPVSAPEEPICGALHDLQALSVTIATPSISDPRLVQGCQHTRIISERATRERNLQDLTNNARFLIPCCVRLLHLASHVLRLIARRIRSD